MHHYLYGIRERRSNTAASSYLDCVTSIGSLHNETINIWSHLLTAIYFTSTASWQFAVCPTTYSQKRAVTLGYTTAAALCFWCSTLYHVFADHVRSDLWQQADHFGIVLLIWASSTSFIIFTFDHRKCARRLYLGVIALAALRSLVRLSAIRLLESRHRDRIVTHTIFGCLAALPGVHVWCRRRARSHHASLLRAFTMLVVLNGAGGGIYATTLLDQLIGERLGVSDISHVVMHIAAAIAAWIFQQGLWSVC